MRINKLMPVPASAPAPVQTDLPMVPQAFAHPGLSLAQITAIVWACRKQFAIIAASVLLVTIVYAKMLPKTYSATATLMVRYEVNEGGKQYAINALGSWISTQIDLMQSSEVLRPVINRLDLSHDKVFSAGFNGPEDARVPYVEKNLAKALEIVQGPQGNQLIYVSASAQSAVLAANIANAVADVYKEKEVSWVNTPATERAREYSTQLAELKAKVQAAQDQVTAFRQKTGIADVTTENDAEMLKLTNLQQQLQEAQNSRRALEAQQADVGGNTAVAQASNVVQALKTQLATQQSSLAQLQTTLGPNNPKVIELKSQIEATQHALSQEARGFNESRNASLKVARDLEEKLQAALNEQRSKVLAYRKIRDDGSKLVLGLESAQTVYKRALDGYDQIMFASSSGEQRSNINFVSRATPSVKATKPNKIKLVMMGFVGGIFLGLLGPLAFDLLFNRRVRCKDDIERDLGLPVLAEFTDSQSRAAS